MLEEKERKGKCRDLTCNLKSRLNQLNLSHESNKEDEKRKTKQKTMS